MERSALVAKKLIIDVQFHLVVESNNTFAPRYMSCLNLVAKTRHAKHNFWLKLK